MFSIAVPLAGTFKLLGIAPKSTGLDVIEEPDLDESSLPFESPLYNVAGPQITADYLAKVKSMSRS